MPFLLKCPQPRDTGLHELSAFFHTCSILRASPAVLAFWVSRLPFWMESAIHRNWRKRFRIWRGLWRAMLKLPLILWSWTGTTRCFISVFGMSETHSCWTKSLYCVSDMRHSPEKWFWTVAHTSIRVVSARVCRLSWMKLYGFLMTATYLWPERTITPPSSPNKLEITEGNFGFTEWELFSVCLGVVVVSSPLHHVWTSAEFKLKTNLKDPMFEWHVLNILMWPSGNNRMNGTGSDRIPVIRK